MVNISKCTGFDWDDGHSDKNLKHGVSDPESEQIFFREPFIKKGPQQGSDDRYFAFGQTESGRYLFIVFSIRKNLIRVISARDMTPIERRLFQRYER